MLLGELCSPVQFTWCSTVLIHITLLDCFTCFREVLILLILKRYSRRFEAGPMEDKAFFLIYFSLEGIVQCILHKVAKNVSFVICIPDWSLSCHLILNLLSYQVDFSPSEFCINSLLPESKAHTKLCIAHVSLSCQYNTRVSEKYEHRFYFTQLPSSHLPCVCLYKSQSSSLESLISTQLHMLMLHMEGSQQGIVYLAWALGVGLTVLRHKNALCYRIVTKVSCELT